MLDKVDLSAAQAEIRLSQQIKAHELGVASLVKTMDGQGRKRCHKHSGIWQTIRGRACLCVERGTTPSMKRETITMHYA